MLRIVQTFKAHNINDGTTYQAFLMDPYGLPAAQPIYISQAEADSDDAGTYTVETQTIGLRIKILDYANRRAKIAQLQTWFKRGTLGDLVVLYDDDSTQYYKPCRVVNLVQDPEFPMRFTAILQTGWTAWRAVSAETYTWNLTGTGGNYTLALAGDDDAPLSATFLLSSEPANGYLYQRFYQLLNAPQTVPPLGWGPWCITIDTAALVADNSNKCQLNGAILAGDTTIAYDTVTGTIPSTGVGYIGTEQIKWTGKTGTTSGNLTGVTRGIGGTTAASHADNSEIKLSYLLANGDDLRVFVDGQETKRWIASPNNASTKIWFNVTVNTGYSLALRTAIASTGDIDTMDFAMTPDVLAALNAMPNEGILVHGTEWIKYNGKNISTYQLNVTAREILGSTMQAHAAADVFRFMEHVITVCYGKSAATDPAATDAHYDDTKPLFVLASSSNTSWVYDSTSLFQDAIYPTPPARPDRTGSWKPGIAIRHSKYTQFYFTKDFTASNDPAMGMIIQTYLLNGVDVADVAHLTWTLYRACGINTITSTGQKIRSASLWPSGTGLQKSVDGASWLVIWLEGSPASLDTWTALGTHTGDAIGDARWVRFIFSGTFESSGAYCAFEILTATVNFTSANLPAGTLLSQQNSAQLALTLSNGANDDAIGIDFPMLPGLELALDGEAKSVLYHNVNAHETMIMNDEGRANWIRLQPGDNELTIASGDVGTLQVVLSWRRRRF